eukprot:TRINITY_DN9406_c0_g1_i1.p1 TRINITY_DN9406_c0_g1~~TRINITY_DN9406_c0_g1_i1.p1  ORF type:complete len:1339 (+),score=264.87 TRINITY_DN9406_c0_g1_i1:70-4086(+)
MANALGLYQSIRSWVESEYERTKSMKNEDAAIVVCAKANQRGYGDVGCIMLADVLRNASLMDNAPRWTALAMRYNKIGDEGISALAMTLSALHGLQAIAFGGNMITDKGLYALEPLLKSPQFRELKMDYNQITNDGMIWLAKVINKNHDFSLMRLSFRANQITEDGVAAVFDALTRTKTSLKEIAFGYNDAGRVGAQALAACLISRKTELQLVDLERASIDSEGMKLICQALDGNNHLRGLVLDANVITVQVAEDFASMLDRNTTLGYLSLENMGLPQSLLQTISAKTDRASPSSISNQRPSSATRLRPSSGSSLKSESIRDHAASRRSPSPAPQSSQKSFVSRQVFVYKLGAPIDGKGMLVTVPQHLGKFLEVCRDALNEKLPIRRIYTDNGRMILDPAEIVHKSNIIATNGEPFKKPPAVESEEDKRQARQARYTEQERLVAGVHATIGKSTSNPSKQIILYRNGMKNPVIRRKIVVPKTMEEFHQLVCQRMGVRGSPKFFDREGVELIIGDLSQLEDHKLLIVSAGEPYASLKIDFAADLADAKDTMRSLVGEDLPACSIKGLIRMGEVHVYKNDPNAIHRGIYVVITIQANLEKFYDRCTLKLGSNFAIRRLYLLDGTPIDSIDQLSDGIEVVATHGEPYNPNATKHPEATLKSVTSILREDYEKKGVFVFENVYDIQSTKDQSGDGEMKNQVQKFGKGVRIILPRNFMALVEVCGSIFNHNLRDHPILYTVKGEAVTEMTQIKPKSVLVVRCPSYVMNRKCCSPSLNAAGPVRCHCKSQQSLGCCMEKVQTKRDLKQIEDNIQLFFKEHGLVFPLSDDDEDSLPEPQVHIEPKAPSFMKPSQLKPTRLFVYRNGHSLDSDFEKASDGKKVVLVQKTLLQLLNAITGELQLPFGCKVIFNKDGSEVTDVAVLEDKQPVFASAGEAFKSMRYAKIFICGGDSTPIRVGINGIAQMLDACSRLSSGGSNFRMLYWPDGPPLKEAELPKLADGCVLVVSEADYAPNQAALQAGQSKALLKDSSLPSCSTSTKKPIKVLIRNNGDKPGSEIRVLVNSNMSTFLNECTKRLGSGFGIKILYRETGEAITEADLSSLSDGSVLIASSGDSFKKYTPPPKRTPRAMSQSLPFASTERNKPEPASASQTMRRIGDSILPPRTLPSCAKHVELRPPRIYVFRHDESIPEEYWLKLREVVVPKTFQLLLNACTVKLDLAFGAQRLFHTSSEEITSIAEIEDGEVVLVTSGAGLKSGLQTGKLATDQEMVEGVLKGFSLRKGAFKCRGCRQELAADSTFVTCALCRKPYDLCAACWKKGLHFYHGFVKVKLSADQIEAPLMSTEK